MNRNQEPGTRNQALQLSLPAGRELVLSRRNSNTASLEYVTKLKYRIEEGPETFVAALSA